MTDRSRLTLRRCGEPVAGWQHRWLGLSTLRHWATGAHLNFDDALPRPTAPVPLALPYPPDSRPASTPLCSRSFSGVCADLVLALLLLEGRNHKRLTGR